MRWEAPLQGHPLSHTKWWQEHAKRMEPMGPGSSSICGLQDDSKEMSSPLTITQVAAHHTLPWTTLCTFPRGLHKLCPSRQVTWLCTIRLQGRHHGSGRVSQLGPLSEQCDSCEPTPSCHRPAVPNHEVPSPVVGTCHDASPDGFLGEPASRPLSAESCCVGVTILSN
jgi:hypothetical protein